MASAFDVLGRQMFSCHYNFSYCFLVRLEFLTFQIRSVQFIIVLNTEHVIRKRGGAGSYVRYCPFVTSLTEQPKDLLLYETKSYRKHN